MKNISIFLIKVYKRVPGKFHNNCKFIPTCSDYAIDAICEYGFIKGFFLSVKRIIRCNPFQKLSYDPVVRKEGKK